MTVKLKRKNNWKAQPRDKAKLFRFSLDKFLEPIQAKMLGSMHSNNLCLALGDPNLFKEGVCLVRDPSIQVCRKCSVSQSQLDFTTWLLTAAAVQGPKPIQSLRKKEDDLPH